MSLRLSTDVPTFRTNVDEVVVPAGGEAAVSVTFDHSAAQVGVHGGRLVARSSAGDTVVQTPVGAYKEPESYDLTTRLIDQNGAAPADGLLANAMWVPLGTGRDDYDLMGNGSTVRLPAGRYAVLGTIQTAVPGQPLPTSTRVADPEVDLRQDTTVTLDARNGRKVTVQTEEEDARPFSWTNGMVIDTGARGVGYYSMSDYDDYAVPTSKHIKEFRYFDRVKLERPQVRLTVAEPESLDVPVEWVPGSPRTTGTRALSAVDVGHATPGEIAAADLEGKLAVFTLGDGEGLEFSPRVRAIAEAGADSALFHHSGSPVRLTEAPPLPLTATFGPEGARLAKLPNASVTLAGLPASPYRYELVFPSYGDVPANVTYRPRNSDLATVKTTYRAPVEGSGHVTAFATDGRYELEGGLESTPTAVPRQRTEYYSPATWSNSVSVLAGGVAQDYAAARRTLKAGDRTTVDWGKAVIGPGVTGSPGFFSAEPHLAYRVGEKINARLPLFSDSAGHSGFPGPGDTGDTVLFLDGEEVARSGQPGSGQFTVPAGAANYRLTAEASRTSPGWPLSTKVSAEWGFRSGHTTAATPLPLLSIGFDPELDLTNHAPRDALVPGAVARRPPAGRTGRQGRAEAGRGVGRRRAGLAAGAGAAGERHLVGGRPQPGVRVRVAARESRGPGRHHGDPDDHPGVPGALTAELVTRNRPSWTSATWSAAMRCARSCVTSTVAVARWWVSRVMSSTTAAPRSWSRALVGSSTSRTAGSFIKARAMLTRWRWPPESWCGRRFACGARPTASSRSIARPRAAAGERPSIPAMTWSCSTAVRAGSRLGCWKTTPILRRRSSASSPRVRPVAVMPSTTTVPASGVTRVAATASRLDLPEPEGPTTAVRLPLGTSSATWSSAVRRESPSG